MITVRKLSMCGRPRSSQTASETTLRHGIHGQGQASVRLIRGCPGNHSDAVDNGADAETQSTAGTRIRHSGQVGFGMEAYGLQTEMESVAVPARTGPGGCGQPPPQCWRTAAELPDRRGRRKRGLLRQEQCGHSLGVSSSGMWWQGRSLSFV